MANPLYIEPGDPDYASIIAEQIVLGGEYFPWNGDIWRMVTDNDSIYFIRVDKSSAITSFGKTVPNLNQWHAPDNFYDTM